MPKVKAGGLSEKVLPNVAVKLLAKGALVREEKST